MPLKIVRHFKSPNKVLGASTLLIILFYYKKIATSPCNTFTYKYPIENVSDIVKSILLNKTINTKPINMVSATFHRIYDVRCDVTTQLVIIIKSYIGNFEQRSAIRATWIKGHGENVKVVFMLGYSKQHVRRVKEEHKFNKDIVQFSFKDMYRNNIYKTIMSYDWIISNCASTNFIFFVDDDFFVNVRNILTFARRYLDNQSDEMYGHLRCFDKPVRNKTSKYNKWYISADDYPFDVYPPYLSGGSILINIAVIRKLQIAFQYVKIFDLDDVYVDLAANKLGIKLVNNDMFVIVPEEEQNIKNYRQNVLSFHGYVNRTD